MNNTITYDTATPATAVTTRPSRTMRPSRWARPSPRTAQAKAGGKFPPGGRGRISTTAIISTMTPMKIDPHRPVMNSRRGFMTRSMKASFGASPSNALTRDFRSNERLDRMPGSQSSSWPSTICSDTISRMMPTTVGTPGGIGTTDGSENRSTARPNERASSASRISCTVTFSDSPRTARRSTSDVGTLVAPGSPV